ncbi:hypothetical protein HAP47_0010255 [Bradyrhizobium sp. 41S5]|uniref:hypothetical protein n=1 Tax=Bradyrhizobium sp. 41S5 TaxID=1404443 RepID=UPI00156B0499|nr:hypothetical protein [Bradyrhizobium sp. 41S5]UFX47016.1 hypothetical protein HAP47_0010255 [Bradyrhizobium sp. 41S5]
MNRPLLMMIILLVGMFEARADPQAVQCSSYYISEINLISTADAEAGHVQTYVGFGTSKEEAEKSALGWCSHIRFDLETCLNSDRMTGRNSPSQGGDNSLHLKYMKAVRRITGCS